MKIFKEKLYSEEEQMLIFSLMNKKFLVDIQKLNMTKYLMNFF